MRGKMDPTRLGEIFHDKVSDLPEKIRVEMFAEAS
jgi:hypothetical protein